ncbi:CPBP family intramembrane glutamic endopeptidase [Romboutsia sp.]|uniref:CPBP family intramembrane glutamic endopeptidase n=1 Tax=Romboutsia sp. TaxID=1965302 RepID=UPI003F359400
MSINKELNKKDIKISLVFTFLAAFAGVLIGLYSSIKSVPIPNMSRSMFVAVSALQVAILYGLILGFIGLKLSRAVNLDNKGLLGSIYEGTKYSIDFNGLKFALGFGFINACVITLSEKFIFAKLIPEIGNSTPEFSPLYLISGIVYGGIVEEIMLRLFLMSFVVFVLYKLFARKADKSDIPNWIYLVSIVIAAILFGVGHLPATYMLFKVTPIVIFRVVLLNAFAGILFGYLYWKKGFEYGIIAHMFSHIFMQLALIPILY